MNQTQTEILQYDATREEYEYTVVEEETFNPEKMKQLIVRKLDILTSETDYYSRTAFDLSNRFVNIIPYAP